MGEEDYCVAEGGNLESVQLEELRNVDRRISWLYLSCSIQFDESTYKRLAQTSKLKSVVSCFGPTLSPDSFPYQGIYIVTFYSHLLFLLI